MTAETKPVREVLESSIKYLEGKGVVEAKTLVLILMGRLLGCKHMDVYARQEQGLVEKQLEAMRRALKRLAIGEPVQYITGETEFLGRVFKTDKRALIPRPETELLVEAVLKNTELWTGSKPVIVDFGTGSGCIVISLALAREGVYVAIDISKEALDLANKNAELHGVADKVAFSAEELNELIEPCTVDVFVSNPPYIRESDFLSLPVNVRDHEPRQALIAGETGLEVITQIVEEAAIVLKPGGFLYLEIGYNQAADVTHLMKEYGFADISIVKDFAGHQRIISGRLS